MNEQEKQIWLQNAPKLIERARSMANRIDAWGGYYQKGGSWKITTRKQGEQKSDYYPASDFIKEITNHYDLGTPIGLHSGGPDSTCKWGVWDYDSHDGDKVLPDPLPILLHDYATLKAQGVKAIMECSGNGSYHMWVFFNTPTNMRDLHFWGKQFPHEFFPKQEKIWERCKYGNWIRLPGKHKSKETLSYFLNPDGSPMATQIGIDLWLNPPLNDFNFKAPEEIIKPRVKHTEVVKVKAPSIERPEIIVIPEITRFYEKLSARYDISEISGVEKIIQLAKIQIEEVKDFYISLVSPYAHEYKDGYVPNTFRVHESLNFSTLHNSDDVFKGMNVETFIYNFCHKLFLQILDDIEKEPRDVPHMTDVEWSIYTSKLLFTKDNLGTYLYDSITDAHYTYSEDRWKKLNNDTEAEDIVDRFLDREIIAQKAYVQLRREMQKKKNPEIKEKDLYPAAQSRKPLSPYVYESVRRNHSTALTEKTVALTLKNGVYEQTPNPDLMVFRNMTYNPFTKDAYYNTPKIFDPSGRSYNLRLDADEPTYTLNWLNQIFDGDQEKVNGILDMLAECMFPQMQWQYIHYLYGVPRSGKGVITRLAEKLVGDMFVGVDDESIQNDFGCEEFIGKRLIVFNDMPERLPANVINIIKRISGGDTISINQKHKPHVSMKIPARMLFSGNSIFNLSDKTGAIEARLRVVKFTNSFAETMSPEVEVNVHNELELLAPYLLKRLPDIRKYGITKNTDTKEVCRDITENSNPVKNFANSLLWGTEYYVNTTDLYQIYVQWAKDNGIIPAQIETNRKFHQLFNDKRLSIKNHGKDRFVGCMPTIEMVEAWASTRKEFVDTSYLKNQLDTI